MPVCGESILALASCAFVVHTRVVRCCVIRRRGYARRAFNRRLVQVGRGQQFRSAGAGVNGHAVPLPCKMIPVLATLLSTERVSRRSDKREIYKSEQFIT